MKITSGSDEPRLISFYYPQFHQSDLNDRLYGPGFTEWTNVERAEPLFPGHRQPRVPDAALGHYSLDDPETYAKQVEMARSAGISGFCFYHYWMTGGRRVLDRPFAAAVEGDIDFPFCLMWANHDWTMAWRGKPHITTLEMTYAVQDPAEFVADIADALNDRRYIRIDDKPLLIIYDLDGPADLSAFIQGLRTAATEKGVDGLFIAGVQYRIDSPNRLNPHLDALCEFVPHGYREGYRIEAPPDTRHDSNASFFDYRKVASASLLGVNLAPGIRYFRCLSPDWDNTSRRMENLDVTAYLGSTPERYGQWAGGLLREAAEDNLTMPLVFVNAWNEWGEAAYLEPDVEHGAAFLDATRNAVNNWRDAPRSLSAAQELMEHDQAGFWEIVPRRPALSTRVPNGETVRIWLDQLQFQTGPFVHEAIVYQGICDISGFVQGSGPGSAEYTLCFCSDTGETYEVKLAASVTSEPLQATDVESSNMVIHGFSGRIDFREVPVGEYTLRIPLAAGFAGVLPTPMTVVGGVPTDTVPRPRTPNVAHSLFEPTTSYTATVSPGSAHQLIESIVASSGAHRVLDCGCADGSFGAHLTEHLGVEVHGLEFDQKALALARTRLTTASHTDFERDDWQSQVNGTFDALTFIDVLEHVRRPDLVLLQAQSLIRPAGVLIASIPNIAHISQRVALARGNWQYEDWGLLDRTHLRFFTISSIEQLFKDAGYRISDVQHTAAPENVDSTVPPELQGLVDLQDDSSFAYQYIVVAQRA